MITADITSSTTLSPMRTSRPPPSLAAKFSASRLSAFSPPTARCSATNPIPRGDPNSSRLCKNPVLAPISGAPRPCSIPSLGFRLDAHESGTRIVFWSYKSTRRMLVNLLRNRRTELRGSGCP
ncbi:hypothetical protein OE88DRAFT_485879 [Heliocybe sulcata]|uniref:Uncharacterized protein n=1 Tax=Heliocybe sulcata TaxID=5364 RepID=A0A5C3MUN0_9AGAM|nr:hypothetical protein OE88DRAFT_485879 [Heliocybe sulcata]